MTTIYIPIRKNILARIGRDGTGDIKFDDYEASNSELPMTEDDIIESVLRKINEKYPFQISKEKKEDEQEG